MNKKRFVTIAKAVYKTEMVRVAEEYDEFFEKKLKEHGADSPADLSDEEKKDFFNEVDEEWDAEKETD